VPAAHDHVKVVADQRLQKESRHLLASDAVGRHHSIGSGPSQLVRGVVRTCPGDDQQPRVEHPCGQGDKDVHGIRPCRGHKTLGLLDAGRLQSFIACGISAHHEEPFALCPCQGSCVYVDDHNGAS